MKEQEQKNLNTQEQSPQQNQDKSKAQSPKTKVIVWSTAGATIAALSSVASLTTVFSNQRKVSFLDKVLQSIKIDVKDKETKTKDDIKTIANFVSSNLDTKLYELVVEEVNGEVNKQPLDKDKPYTTFRTKFALRNKITKAQSNYKIFEFRDIKPPKEKEQLNELGKISENEIDRVNDKVKIEFINFNRGRHLASAVAAKDESGKYKYFNIYLKQDNSDTLQYEIVNVNVETNDNEAEATFSYQLKVKSIEDEKFISDKLSIKFKDFAIPSTQLTHYLNSLDIKYKDASSTYIQDASKEGIIEGTTLSNPNYSLEFESFEKLENEQKVKARVKIVDKNTKESSEFREVEMEGFFDYKKVVQDASDAIVFNYNDKENTFANNLKKINLTNTLVSLPNSNNLEVVYYGDELAQEDENDPKKRLNAIVSFKIKDKKTQFESEQKSYTINGFKDYRIKSELNDYLKQIVLDVESKNSKYIDDISEYSHITKSNFDSAKYQIDLNSFVIEKLSDLTSIKVHFRITENNTQNIFSDNRTIEIKDFKIPQKLLNEWANKIKLDVPNKQNELAYNYWDDFSKITKENLNDKFEFDTQNITVKQTDADEITVRFKIKDKQDPNTISDLKEIVIKGFKKQYVNSEKFGYYLYEQNGHKVACLNSRKIQNIFVVPDIIDSFKVKKAMSLYIYENFSRHYSIYVSEGIEEVENLIYTNEFATSDLLALSLPKTLKVAKNVIVGQSKKLLYLEMPSNIEHIESLYESSNTILGDEEVFQDFAYHFGSENFYGKSLDPNDKKHWKGGFRVKLYDSQNPNYEIKEELNRTFSFLIKKNGNKLVKLIEKKITPDQLDLNLTHYNINEIVTGALYGSKASKITLVSNTISNLENLFSLSNKNLKELDLSGVLQFKHFNNLGPSFNNIEKIVLPNDMGEKLSFDFANWKSLKEVKLPSTVKTIASGMFYGCNNLENVNFTDLINLEKILHPSDKENDNEFPKSMHFVSSKVIKKIDLSATKLRALSGYAFQGVNSLEEIVLPSTLQKVGSFIAYRSYLDKGTEDVNDDEISFGNKMLTIKIKVHASKPSGWSDKWIGQYWSQSAQTGTNTAEVKIEWAQ
ncbi:leucine-rich repeat protein [Metamycoplasma hyosynoviae]|uniref:leucine-rich repeat protein n=2 Tax=Metamycoplasma hyosynoviae TaxID=29559 RepID=UPI002358EBED|nr:leucine-rich repeat protein [Metamycoplasma hyosynoviae]MDC8938214.1 leucine-rich repeat protein [Metamycoplasma hyosynoviae]